MRSELRQSLLSFQTCIACSRDALLSKVIAIVTIRKSIIFRTKNEGLVSPSFAVTAMTIEIRKILTRVRQVSFLSEMTCQSNSIFSCTVSR